MSKESKIHPINYSCHIAEFREGEQFVESHGLGIVLSGAMELYDGERKELMQEGDLYVTRKNQLVKFVKYPPPNGEFKSLSIRFGAKLLHDFSLEYGHESKEESSSSAFIKLKADKNLLSFMKSMLEYQGLLDAQITNQLLEIKQKEALILLLNHNPFLKDVLFDFSEPHKIDLEKFMQKNYHFNVQLERFAYLTGRSLSTFQRDFAKIFHETPSRWLLQKRLSEAYYLIKEKGKNSSEIYLDLGFEDLSHFSYAFKKKYGESPSRITN
jgi:AraC family transcriptional regulator, exoenzyme S synthesis regulatory protein ExsA